MPGIIRYHTDRSTVTRSATKSGKLSSAQFIKASSTFARLALRFYHRPRVAKEHIQDFHVAPPSDCAGFHRSIPYKLLTSAAHTSTALIAASNESATVPSIPSFVPSNPRES